MGHLRLGMFSHVSVHFASAFCDFQLFLAASLLPGGYLLRIVQSFAAIGLTSRAFERRLEVGPLRRELRRTSLGFPGTFFLRISVASSLFVRNTART